MDRSGSGFFPQSAAHKVAAQIGQHISILLSHPIPHEIAMTDTFRVWRYAPRSSQVHYAGLRRVFVKTDYYHHQINFDGRAAAYARTKVVLDDENNKDWEFRELAISPLAENVHIGYKGLIAADQIIGMRQNSSHVLISLVILPRHKLSALWAHSKDTNDEYICIVESMPDSNLPLHEIQTGADFFDLLANRKMAEGVVDDAINQP